jgi:hypothetical protein
MATTFNDLELFESGPHRFRQLPLGEYVVRNAAIDPFQPGSTAAGPLELIIELRGRLIADSEDDLWTLRDDIAAQLSHPPVVATLKEPGGRTWTDMAFVEFAPADRTDRGRRFSLAYTATFIRFL